MRVFWNHCIKASKTRAAKTLLERQENDGSLLDYPLYEDHRQYGTAIAVVALVPPEKPFYGK